MCRCPRLVRLLVLLLPLLAAGFLVFLPAALRGDAPNPAVELILRGASTDEEADATLLSPSAAFELRAAVPLVTVDRVGQPAADSPLVLTPALPGAFRWTSQRGGVFTPSEPPPLGTTYKVALRPDLKDAAGEPIRAEFRQTFHTPPLEVRGVHIGYRDDEPDRGPRMELLFNAAVDPARIADSLSYRNPAGGPAVPVSVKVPTDRDRFVFGPKIPARTWRERFAAAHAPSSTDPAVPRAEAINRLIVTPAQPLPAGKKWKLVAAAGLTGTDPGATLPAAVEIAAGDVEPFEVKKIEAANDGAQARSLTITFSRPLGKNLSAETRGKWIHVSPAPADMKIDGSWNNSVFEVKGGFEIDRDYEVTVSGEVVSAGGLYKLPAEKTQTVRFLPEPPLIAFTGYHVDQLSAGRRDFALEARNAAEVRLRAKLIPPDQAMQARLAFQKGHLDPKTGEFQDNRLDFDRFPGKVVFEKEVAGSTELDKPATVSLSWDDVLGPRRNGTVLLEAEQPRPTGKERKRAGAQVLVQVTDLGVVWKTSRAGELLTYVFSMANAASIKANVRLLDADGRPLTGKRGAGATTLSDGLAWVPSGTGKAAWLEVTAVDDCHVIPFGNERGDSLSLYRFHLPPSAFPDDEDSPADGSNDGDAKAAAPKPPPREVLLFTERGVYKPGEEAHLKTIAREWRGDGLANVPAGTAATLRAFDAKGRRFWEKDVTFSAAGSLAETIPLPKSGLGHYRVEIAFDGKKTDDAGTDDTDDTDDDSDDPTPGVCRFQVQEYQPNAFLVKLAKPASDPIGAGPVPLTLSARYYMGKTISHATAVWSLKAVDSTFRPDGFDEYVFGSSQLDSRFSRRPGELALDGRGALSDRGRTAVRAADRAQPGVAGTAPGRHAGQRHRSGPADRRSAHDVHGPQLGFLPGRAPDARRGPRGRAAAPRSDRRGRRRAAARRAGQPHGQALAHRVAHQPGRQRLGPLGLRQPSSPRSRRQRGSADHRRPPRRHVVAAGSGGRLAAGRRGPEPRRARSQRARRDGGGVRGRGESRSH